MIPLDWDGLHEQSRQEIVSGAALNPSLAQQRWKDVPDWLRVLLNVRKSPNRRRTMYELLYIEGLERPCVIVEPPGRVVFKLAKRHRDLAEEILFNLNSGRAGDDSLE